VAIWAKRCVKHAFKRQLSGEPQYNFCYTPCTGKLFELALPVLLTKPFEQVSPNANSENTCSDPPCSVPLRSAPLHPVLYMHALAQATKNIFSPARNSAGNTRGSLSLHCSQSLRRTCPKKLFVKHCSISRHSVSRHSAPRHPCSYTHGITNILKKSPGADQPNGRNLRHEPGAVQTNGRNKAELFEKTVRKNSSNSPCSASLHDAQHHSVHLYARVHTSI